MRKKRNRKFNKKQRQLFTPRVYTKIINTLLLLLGIAALVVYISSLGIFQVDTIETNISVDRDVVKEIKGQSLVSIDVRPIYRKISKRHPEIKEVYIKKKFPSTLVIDALRRKPFAQLKEDGFYVLDKDGVVLEKRRQNPYPGIFIIELGDYRGSFNIGKTVHDKRLYLAYRLIRELKKSGLINKFKIDTINAASLHSVSFFMGDVNIIVGKDNFHKKLSLLENLLDRKLNNKMDSIRYIDLRYASSDDNIYIGNKR